MTRAGISFRGPLFVLQQVHRFASALLLPRHAFAAEFPRGRTLDWAGLYQIMVRWKVSA